MERGERAVRYDFLGPSYLVNGEWVRTPFKLTNKERCVYPAWGRFFKKLDKARENQAQADAVESVE